MIAPRLPAHVRKYINKLAYQLARVEDARYRKRLTDQATTAVTEGVPISEVLILLNTYARASA